MAEGLMFLAEVLASHVFNIALGFFAGLMFRNEKGFFWAMALLIVGANIGRAIGENPDVTDIAIGLMFTAFGAGVGYWVSARFGGEATDS